MRKGPFLIFMIDNSNRLHRLCLLSGVFLLNKVDKLGGEWEVGGVGDYKDSNIEVVRSYGILTLVWYMSKTYDEK